MQTSLQPQTCHTPRHRVRELVCTYRPARDRDGRIIHVASLALTDPPTAARILAPLMAEQPVEAFGVACLSARHRLLAWHLVSRGTRDSTPVSVPDVFLPACVTPGTVALLVVHNHPSGDPTPSPDDVALTVRLRTAADALDVSLLDHLIVGEEHRYYSFRETGLLGHSPPPGGHEDLAGERDLHVTQRTVISEPAAPTWGFCGSARSRQGFARCARRSGDGAESRP